MKKLENKVSIRGTGIHKLTATCIIRTPKKCIYLRSDEYYEVFIVTIVKEGDVFGKLLPEREVYPCNEDFGKTAWTCKSEKRAYEIYNRI